MTKNHLKRLVAPRSWELSRKAQTFVTRPKPGRAFALAMPLSHIMKVVLEKGNTTKEVRYILQHSEVLVNGTRVHDHRRPVGFMDVLSFPEIKEFYRISLSRKGRLTAVLIDEKKAATRLVQITGKTVVSGKIQINCADGTNLLVQKNEYSTGDSLAIEAGKITKHFELSAGAHILLTGGSHFGMNGTVTHIDGKVITFTNKSGEFTTAKRYAYVVGTKTAEVTLS